MKVHVFAPNIVIGITFYYFRVGKKLVRSRTNYFSLIVIEHFCMTDNTNFADFFGSIAIGMIELLYS